MPRPCTPPRRDPLAAGGEGQAAAVRHGVARVQGEVEDRELELVGIDAHQREPILELHIDLDDGAERAPQHLHHAVDEARHVHRLGPQLLAPREGEHALGQGRAALGGLDRGIDQRLARDPVGHVARHEVEIAEDRHQHVVEIVREPARELAEALELLHLVHLRQRHLALARALLDAALELGIGLGELRRPFHDAALELDIEVLELARLAIKLGKDPNLGAQHVRHHRHRHVIDRAMLVALDAVDVGEGDRRDEDDGDRLEAGMGADHLRELEPVEIGHDDVDEDDGDIVPQQMLERLLRRGRGQKVLAQLAQDDLVAHQLRRLIVDEQDIDAVVFAHWHSPLFPRVSGAATCAAKIGAARY